jgi:hypothetical protein
MMIFHGNSEGNQQETDVETQETKGKLGVNHLRFPSFPEYRRKPGN